MSKVNVGILTSKTGYSTRAKVACPSYYLAVVGVVIGFMFFPKTFVRKETKPHSGFEFWSLNPFPVTITVSLNVPQYMPMYNQPNSKKERKDYIASTFFCCLTACQRIHVHASLSIHLSISLFDFIHPLSILLCIILGIYLSI